MLVCIHTYYKEVKRLNKRQKTEFGVFLVEQIKNAKMSQEEFYNAVGIKKPYFYNLLTSSPPPIDLQNRMLKVYNDRFLLTLNFGYGSKTVLFTDIPCSDKVACGRPFWL